MTKKKAKAEVKEAKTEKKKKTVATQAVAEKKGEIKAASAEGAPAEGLENNEENDEDFAEEAAAARSGKASEEAALSAVTSTDSGSGSLKNFRHHPDIENFYRFIYENDLRYEALGIIDELIVQKQMRKQLKAEKAKAH